MPISADDLRFAMRRWATGVTIVSARHEGVYHGMTASTFTSLSLTPPYVMVSLEQSTRTHDLVSDSRSFGVTILSGSQEAVSNRFANAQTELGSRFEGLETFTMESGAPFIKGGLAFFDCRVVGKMDAGTHSVYVGEVIAVREGEASPPLIYFNQGYRRLAEATG